MQTRSSLESGPAFAIVGLSQLVIGTVEQARETIATNLECTRRCRPIAIMGQQDSPNVLFDHLFKRNGLGNLGSAFVCIGFVCFGWTIGSRDLIVAEGIEFIA